MGFGVIDVAEIMDGFTTRESLQALALCVYMRVSLSLFYFLSRSAVRVPLFDTHYIYIYNSSRVVCVSHVCTRLSIAFRGYIY